MRKLVYAKQLEITKQVRHMAITKLMLSLLSWIGFPLLGISWLANLDNIKSTIIFIVSLSMVLIRFYFGILNWLDNRAMKAIQRRKQEIELRHKELDLIERENKVKK